MARKQKHYFVNWIDGMKINKDHFTGMENAMIWQQNLSGRMLINPYNFGLFSSDEAEPSVDISFRVDANNHVGVTLNRCKAITSGGILIDLDPVSGGPAEFDVSINDFDLQSAESDSGKDRKSVV